MRIKITRVNKTDLPEILDLQKLAYQREVVLNKKPGGREACPYDTKLIYKLCIK